MKKVFLLFLFASLSTTIFAHSYFVKSEQEFKAIVPTLRPGDEVTIANGNYSNWNIAIPTKATAVNPIVLKAETGGKVIFSGHTTQTIFSLTGAFITLRGISFKDCVLAKADGKTGLLVELKNSEHCSLIDCEFISNKVISQFMPLVVVSGNGNANKIAQCIFIGNIDSQDLQVKITNDSCPRYTLIEHNKFKNKTKVSWENGNGGECVQIGQDPVLLGAKEAKTLVQDNYFERCNGENEIISNKSSGNTYQNNQFIDNDGELVMRGGHDCLIKGNSFEGGTGGIRINGTGHQVIGNKINGIKTAIRLMYGMAKGKTEVGFYIAASNCTIRNNEIAGAITGILVGDSKNIDWTGKFDIKRYPSPVIQNIAPFDNIIENNKFSDTKNTVVTN